MYNKAEIIVMFIKRSFIWGIQRKQFTIIKVWYHFNFVCMYAWFSKPHGICVINKENSIILNILLERAYFLHYLVAILIP